MKTKLIKAVLTGIMAVSVVALPGCALSIPGLKTESHKEDDDKDKKDKDEAEDLIDKTKKALEGEDLDKIKSAKDELLKKANELATKVYEEAAKQNAHNSEQAEEPKADSKDDKKDDVVDAEYEEK